MGRDGVMVDQYYFKKQSQPHFQAGLKRIDTEIGQTKMCQFRMKIG
jgi:hypothetical protein